RGHAEQAETGAARIGLAHALVNLLERVLHVREPVMAVLGDPFEALAGQRPELGEHPVESLLANRVLLLWRGGDRREANFPEPHLLGEMAIDACDVERVGGERDARANRPRWGTPKQL